MSDMIEVGKVEGTKIYIKEPLDEWEIVKKRIEREVDKRKVKDGDGYMMQVGFSGKHLMIEMKVKEIKYEI